jgi:YdjC-like protein
MTALRTLGLLSLVCLASTIGSAQQDPSTYAEKLGWPKGTRALILHVDDVGMSYDTELGAIEAIEKGVANSLSVMMPTPWVPHAVEWIKAARPDAGLHLTLTSEWKSYRWGPVAGKPAVPGLVDPQGALWPNVASVVKHATADEVEREIRAQLDRARTMGFEPTHLDSHMGTLFATDAFRERYIKVGIEQKIPVMFAGGHNSSISQSSPGRAPGAREIGLRIWAGGLPVLDDIHNNSYDWKTEDKVDLYIDAVRGLKPGVTMMIMHCTRPTEVFAQISGSGTTRLGDLKAMLDPRLRTTLADEHIVLTTWRELMERRKGVSASRN